MIRRSKKNICAGGLFLCFWTISVTQMFNHRLKFHMSRNGVTPDGWKFNTSFPVDLVYTWVNGSDPTHREILARFKKELSQSKALTATRAKNLDFQRFADNGGLRYSLRSVEKYANWIRHVFIVTNGQVPSWLNLENPRVTIVKHEEIFDNTDNLPTFSSTAIEHNIHRIRGVSDRFIYMNDDIFFVRNVSIEDFFTERNGTKVYLALPAATQCNNKCRIEMIKNDVCDDVCNYDHCAWDGGDCDDFPERLKPKDTDTANSDHDTSIFYTNAIYNRAFGQRERRRIVHAPLFIDKRLNEDMVKKFSKEVKETCRHKVRSPFDLQFGYSYMHFLMEEEVHTNRFEPLISSPVGAFVSVTVNVTIDDLNSLEKPQRKFYCMNDDIDYSDTAAAEKTITMLREFYESKLPSPSSFELNR